jgi:arsenate reductase
MAEAIVNTTMGDRWQAFSAGTEPSGYVHPKAVWVLSEIGIQHQGESKHTRRYREVDFDLVVTVCDDAAESCPVWLGKSRRVHVGFPDPAKATGTEEQILAVFRQVRDDIADQIPDILKEINE